MPVRRVGVRQSLTSDANFPFPLLFWNPYVSSEISAFDW